MLKLDRSSTQAVSVENYEIRFFRSDYTHILEYLCRVSFHTTQTYIWIILRAITKGCSVLKIESMHIVTGSRNCSSSSYSLYKLLRLYAKGFVIKELPDLHCWMNLRTLQPTFLSSWCVSHVLRSVYYWLVMYWSRALNGEIAATIQILLGIVVRVQL